MRTRVQVVVALNYLVAQLRNCVPRIIAEEHIHKQNGSLELDCETNQIERFSAISACFALEIRASKLDRISLARLVS
jgi:hypothetical protein